MTLVEHDDALGKVEKKETEGKEEELLVEERACLNPRWLWRCVVKVLVR